LTAGFVLGQEEWQSRAFLITSDSFWMKKARIFKSKPIKRENERDLLILIKDEHSLQSIAQTGYRQGREEKFFPLKITYKCLPY
jgi:hypothetical protein